MATLKRSRDHSLWFKHINDPDDSLLTELRTLAPGQSVVLRIGQRVGVWVRFNASAKGIAPEALKCGDAPAKDIWNGLPVGAAVDIELVDVFSKADVSSSNRRKKKEVQITPLSSDLKGDVLCMAVDVAWWGGQRGSGKKESRTETIAYTSRVDGKWSQLSLKRIDLNRSYDPKADRFTPNADADASRLAEGIKCVLNENKDFQRVILGVDMPILAIDTDLPRPRKANKRGEKGGGYRQCDKEWMNQRDASPKGWKAVNIFTGAPLVPRVEALVAQLRKLDFEVYSLCESDQKRIVFECFPNEVVWSAGVLNLAEGFTIDSLQLYKRLGKKQIPLQEQVFHGVWKQAVNLAFTCARVESDTIGVWLSGVEAWLTQDGVFDAVQRIGKTGKKFDDAIDSVLSLAASVGFVTGNAHIHQGVDPEDGHIIGPGKMD